MITRIARLISIAGHPAILMPLAAAIASPTTDDPKHLFLSVMVAIFFAVLVFAYSQVKTSTGKWKHADASIKSERKELNRAASIILFVSAVALNLFKVHSSIVTAVALSGLIVMASHFFSKIAKPSLHVGFAVFAACLTWPNEIAFATLVLFTAFIGWARLHLERHTRLDLAIGMGIGLFAGFCFQVISRFL